ncbi:MAG: DNA polymerase [Candidatus Spechtbacterales bacterium]|nr:DNA polymerase [Candidatus Spechtbacterales bacterium]
MNQKNKRPLLIVIDSNSLFHRAYHALPRFKTKKGELVNAVYGFSLVLMKALKEHKPKYIAATFDVAGPTFRSEEYEEYKAGREKAPDELYEQIPRIKEVLAAFNIPVYEKEGFEADDVIATVAEKINQNKKNINTLIVSGDLDTLQLVNDNTSVYTMKRSVKDTIIYDEEAVVDRYSLEPEQLNDYKGLRGDPSDNIPGVPGVGEKTATTLLKKYPTLEDLYDALEQNKVEEVTERICKILKENKEQAFFSRMLATVKKDVPIDFKLSDAEWGGFDPEDVRKLFKELNFNALLQRLSDLEGFDEVKEEAEVEKPRKKELLDEVESAHDAGLFSDEIYKLEKEIVPIIIKMEDKGIGFNKEALKDLQQKVQKKLDKVEKKIYKEAGEEFNVNSPQQLSEILFEKLEISSNGLKKTPGKKISTAASELEKLKGKHSIIDLILEQRELQKLISTYINPLPELVADDGRIHTTFNPLGTATGRMSSSDPNLQNIPIHSSFASDIRNAFIADKGKKFLACDYSQMELRLIAHLANDKNMIEVFANDEDIHISTAALVFGVKKEDVSSDMRYRAKALNFGIIYGIGPRAFSRSADISFEEAKDFINKYLDVFEDVAMYMEEMKNKAHKQGYAETMFGRKRFLPDLRSPNPMLRSYAERAAINHPVQGTGADIVKMAMVKTEQELEGIDLLLQIHDELLWEGSSGKIKEVAPKAKKLLEGIVKLSVPLKVEYNIGESWGELK